MSEENTAEQVEEVSVQPEAQPEEVVVEAQPEAAAEAQPEAAGEVQPVDEPSLEVRESDLRSGLKVAANNPDAMTEVEEAENDEDFEPQLPSFFVEETDRQRVEVDILHDPRTGKIVSISKVGMGINFDGYEALVHSKEWLEFKPPTYDNMAAYRQNATITTADGKRIVDRTSIRNFLMVRHLKDWSFRGRNGEKAELSFKDNGALDEESIEKVYSVPPTIIDVVLTIFEKDILLT